jgi:hypothetical protein
VGLGWEDGRGELVGDHGGSRLMALSGGMVARLEVAGGVQK